jgi:hypothetical protein
MMQVEANGPIMRCAKCSSESFLAQGRCILARKCELYKLVESEPAYHFFKDSMEAFLRKEVIQPEFCSCQSQTVDSAGNPILNDAGQSEMNSNCQRCTVRKVTTGLDQPWEYKMFQGVQCSRCKRHTYYNPQTGNCLAKEEAVKKAAETGFVVYDVQSSRNEIEMPFSCVNRVKSTTGKKCMCPGPMRRAGALICDFTVAPDGSTEVKTNSCENEQYLSEGSCVASCPAGQTHYNTRTSHRSCEKPFVCDQETGLPLVNGQKCKCPHWHTAKCSWHADNKVVRKEDGPKNLKFQASVSTIIECKGTKLIGREFSYSLDAPEEVCTKPENCKNIRDEGSPPTDPREC